MRRLRKLRHLRTPLGRHHLLLGATNYLWRPAKLVASCYRRTLGHRTRVVAVVGSFGKTTTTAAILTMLGLPLPARRGLLRGTTYASLALALLRVPPWQRHAAFEVAIDGPGQMAPYGRMLRPDVVVVTSIGSEHHRSLGTLEATRDEKARMLEGLRPGGIAVLNRDDPEVMAMVPPAGTRILTFGFDPAADVRASDLRLNWPRGTRLTLHAAGTTREVSIRLLGKVMTYPFLAAIAVALAEGLPLDRVVAALAELPPRRGRMQLEPLANGAWLIRDDYKSSLETIERHLTCWPRCLAAGSPSWARSPSRRAARVPTIDAWGRAWPRWAPG